MARLYANENFPQPGVVELRRLGHDVISVVESEHAGRQMTDEQVLEYATAGQRTVITLNRRHFIDLHSRIPQHAGIIVCTVDADFIAQANRIHITIQALSALHGQLVGVNRAG